MWGDLWIFIAVQKENLRKIEGRKRRGQWRMRWLDSITKSMDMSLSKLGDSEGQGKLAYFNPWGCKELDTT